MSSYSSPSPPFTPPSSDSEDDGSLAPVCHQRHPETEPSSAPSPHPLAASAKADRAPPAYEKKILTPPTTPTDFKRTAPYILEQAREPKAKANFKIQRSPSLAENEQKRWDTAISFAIDKAETKLDLSSANLTHIPPSIIDLNSLVVLSRTTRTTVTFPPRAFKRSTTAPSLLPPPHVANSRPFLHSQTTNRLAFGATRQQRENSPNRSKGEVELYLMRNAIRTLPRELFALDCLVVLSLRQNKLTNLPSAIGHLTRLRELNIANNRLTHLPAEILTLRLASLHLQPNPFIPPPVLSDSERDCMLGPLSRRAVIPTLSELLLRHLLAPAGISTSHTPPMRPRTRLEAAMTLAQIDSLPLPTHIHRIVRASTGHGRARVDEEGVGVDALQDMSSNICPSPRHCGLDIGRGSGGREVHFVQDDSMGTWSMLDHDGPVFGLPVEERMEWLSVVAGVQVTENPGARIPVLWRGCGRKCLDFLERKYAVEKKEDQVVFESGSGEGEEEFQFSDEE